MGINSLQLGWISQHDWFLSYTQIGFDEFIVEVREVSVDADNNWSECVKKFEEFSDLKAWAGY